MKEMERLNMTNDKALDLSKKVDESWWLNPSISPRKEKVDDQARIGPVDLLALAIQLEFEQLNRKAYQL